jgi:hypothetical protein
MDNPRSLTLRQAEALRMDDTEAYWNSVYSDSDEAADGSAQDVNNEEQKA